MRGQCPPRPSFLLAEARGWLRSLLYGDVGHREIGGTGNMLTFIYPNKAIQISCMSLLIDSALSFTRG